MPSLSLSGSGQPSSSWKPSASSGSFGQLSKLVGDAVGVVVGIGAAVGVLEPVLVLRLVRALVDPVGNAVAVAVLVDEGSRRSGTPLWSSGAFGQASLMSGMPSLSLSGSGQPSSSWNSSKSSASFGHLSLTSGMPSPSLSGSGQPSSSWKPSRSSGWSGHLSSRVVDAVVVAIAEVGVEVGHQEQPQVGRADAVADPAADATGHRPHPVDRPPPRQVDLERIDVVVELDELVEAAASGDLQDDVGRLSNE